MSANSDAEQPLEAAVDDLYRGPLDEFVSRRDSLARELRGAGDRGSASAVKALRKPSRTAWALNLAVLDDPDAIRPLDAAVAAQSSGTDVRAAIATMRDAVREFAASAARAAGDAGHNVEPAVLAAALSAVLGATGSFEQLRRGRLTEVPEAGGLDLLSALPARPVSDSPPPARKSTRRSATLDSQQVDAAAGAARAAAEEAASELAAALERAGQAQEALRLAEAALTMAEARLRAAHKEAREAQSRRDQAREEADAASAALASAEAGARAAKPAPDVDVDVDVGR